MRRMRCDRIGGPIDQERGMDSIRKEMRGAVALVTLARPKALNALDSATLAEVRVNRGPALKKMFRFVDG